MERITMTLTKIGVIVSLVFNVIVIVLLMIKNGEVSVENITSVLDIIVSVVNLGFVTWVYYKDLKKEKENKKDEKKSYWYHEVLIQQNIHEIQSMFLMAIEYIDKANNDTDIEIMQIEWRKIKDKKNYVNNTFGYILNAYDENMYVWFSEKLLDFEDIITDKATQVRDGEISIYAYINEIKKLEVEIIKTLMEHDINT